MSLFSPTRLVGRLLGGNTAVPSVRIAAVPVHPIETSPEKRPRTLKHLLRANHHNHAILYGPDQIFHNHMPHALCSAYVLGANPEQLNQIYDAVAPELVPWHPSPAEMSDFDWRDFLGDPNYQRAYVDFFEDVLAEHSNSYNWHKVADKYLLGEGQDHSEDEAAEEGQDGSKRGSSAPLALVNCLMGGLGHPLIHLAYAYEMDSRVIAMEALGMAACSYDEPLQKFVEDPAHNDAALAPADLRGQPLLVLLDRAASDKRLDTVPHKDFDSVLRGNLQPGALAAVLEYWNAWDVTANGGGDGSSSPQKDLDPRLREAQEAAIALTVATVKPGTHCYNFFMCHVLTTSHAVRVLLPNIPAKFHASVLRQWWLLTFAVYVSLGRPRIDPDNVPSDRKGKGWKHVENQALTSRWSTDPHYIKVIHAIKQATLTWGDVRDEYLDAAVWFADDFTGWDFD